MGRLMGLMGQCQETDTNTNTDTANADVTKLRRYVTLPCQSPVTSTLPPLSGHFPWSLLPSRLFPLPWPWAMAAMARQVSPFSFQLHTLSADVGLVSHIVTTTDYDTADMSLF